MRHGPPPQPVIPLLKSSHAIYRAIRRIPRAARLVKELAGEGIEGARKFSDAMDGHRADRPMDRSCQATATEARKVELDRSLAPWVQELALGDRVSAEERFQTAITQGEFTSEQIRHLAATLRVNGRPDLAERLLLAESGQPADAASPSGNSKPATDDPQLSGTRPPGIRRPTPSGRDGRLAAHPMLQLPSILPRLAHAENRGLLGRAVRLQFGQRRAETSYRAVRRQLRDRLAGQRVLLLGSGPTAADLTRVPEDVIVVAVNRAPTRLAQIGSVGAGWIWALCLTMGRDHWTHAERIAATLPPPSHTLLEFHAGKRLLGTWNACHWEQVMEHSWRADNPQYIATNDDHVLDHTGFDHASFGGAHLSLGVTMLRHILAAGPDEVFLAGIDLGRGRPAEPHNTYFHTADEFTHDDGSPLISRQQFVHIFDEPYMQALSRWSFPIVTVSAESGVAQFFPVKTLDPINQPEHEPRAA